MTCYGYPADLPPGDAKDAGATGGTGATCEHPYPCYSYPNMCSVIQATSHGTLRAVKPCRPAGLRQMPSRQLLPY